MSNVIVHEETVRKQRLRDRLKTELSMALLDLEATQVEAQNIEMKYLEECGDYEQRCFEAELAYRRTKRKAELIQKAKNLQKPVNMVDIEHRLDDELKDYQEKLQAHKNKLRRLYYWQNGTQLTVEQTSELKRLYRKIVKQVHPDLNPDAGKEELRLFEKAVFAYRHGDLEGLRAIDALLKDPKEEETIDNLDRRIAWIRKSIENVRKRKEIICSTNPYLLKAYLEDSEKMEQHIRELEEMIKEYEDARDRIETKEPVFFS